MRTSVEDWLRLCSSVFALGILIGCSGGPPHRDSSWTPVPITDINMVVGEWEGTVKKDRAALPHGMVRLMIRENGAYLFAGQNPDKAVVGTGLFDIRDGRLISDTEHRALSLSLYDHKGIPVLAVDATNRETGDRFYGEFTKIE